MVKTKHDKHDKHDKNNKVKNKEKKVKVDKVEEIEEIEKILLPPIKVLGSRFSASSIEDILFKLPIVHNPLIGTPKQVQKELDDVVIRMQKNMNSKDSRYQFDRIFLFMHGYLINIVMRQFPYIKGMQNIDIYNQTLFALWTKAIPGFRKGKGMSFLNFAKMCIRRHLITILNASKVRQKDQSLNRAISLDSPFHGDNGEEDGSNTFSNMVPDGRASTDELTASEEALKITISSLMNTLSDFERIVLGEYLATSTYKEIAKNISKKTKQKCEPKSVDNALLRIRKKAIYLKKHSKPDDVPIFIK